MKCAIGTCPNVYVRKGSNISFHGFPNNPNILTAWVAATGVPDFIPIHRSKICSAHFGKDSFVVSSKRMLKPDAVPTKSLSEEAKRRISEYLASRRLESNPMTCILGTDTSITEVAVVRDNVPPSPKFTGVVTTEQHPPPTPAQPNTIKVVDMKKLLQPQPSIITSATQQSAVPESTTSKSSNLCSLFNKYIYKKEYSKSTPEKFVNRTGITASQVLNCLRVILPGEFDLSRMVPNEKVASLVIRYLKLDEKDQQNQEVVKDHLKIIIEAVKAKDNKSVDLTKHPYTKINDRDLKCALAVILPEKFSMIDISDELLALICITLNMDIYTDAYYILIRKIRKYTSEGQKFSEILNRGNKVYDTSLEVEKDAELNEVEENVTADQEEITVIEPTTTVTKDTSDENEVTCDREPRRELVFVDVNRPAESSQESIDQKLCFPTEEYNTQSKKSSLNQSIKEVKKTVPLYEISSSDEEEKEKVELKGHKRKKKNSDNDSDWVPEEEEEEEEIKNLTLPLKKRPIILPEVWYTANIRKLFGIVVYLYENKCSPKAAVKDYPLMFELCRYIQVRPRRETIKLVESKLKYIMYHNLNVNNIKDHLEQLKAKQPHLKPEQSSNNIDKKLKKEAYTNKNDEKLKKKPVVVLRDLLDYTSDQLLFMRKQVVKSNGIYNQITFPMKQKISNNKYSTEQVRKLTEDSYKQFRRIVMKRNGTKALVRVKYAVLTPGTVVYAKNYRHPGVGWVKGIIRKSEGPLKYQVQLDNNSKWICTVDQLRPLIKVSDVGSQAVQRSHRPIKPKQLFDL